MPTIHRIYSVQDVLDPGHFHNFNPQVVKKLLEMGVLEFIGTYETTQDGVTLEINRYKKA